MVAIKSGDHRQKISAITTNEPNQINNKSCLLTAKISPKRKAITSIRIPDINETATKPEANAECATTPSNVSIAYPRLLKEETITAIANDTNNAP